MPELFDPYHKWLGIRPEEQPPNHYRLLGIAQFEQDADVIANAAERQMVHVRSYQLGPHAALSQKLLNEIAAAKICLLNPGKRAEYDAALRGNLVAPAPSPAPEPAIVLAPLGPPPLTRPPISVHRKQRSRLILLAIAAMGLGLGMLALLLSGGDEKHEARTTEANRSAPPTPPVGSPTIPSAPETPLVTKALQGEERSQRESEPIANSTAPPPTIGSAVEAPVPSPPADPLASGTTAKSEPSSPMETLEKAEQRVKFTLAVAASPADFKAVAEECLKLAEQASAKGEQDVGKRLLALALLAARGSGDIELTKKVTSLANGPGVSEQTSSEPASSSDKSGQSKMENLDSAAEQPSELTPADMGRNRGQPDRRRLRATDNLSLFDGETLKGWKPRDPHGDRCWTAGKRVLVCNARLGGSDLISVPSFDDFELHLEFLLERGANSGVFLRGRYEIQLVDALKPLPRIQSCGAIHNLIPPTSNAYRGAGQWNSLDVKLVGKTVTIDMNGQRIIDEQKIDRPTTMPLDGLENQPGPIMLQRWGNGVTRFRNIRVRSLH